MYSKKLVLGIYTISPVHAGSGSETSVIDLPIQREKHTGFPLIWGQSLKGVLRSAFKEEELKGKWKEYAGDYIRAVLSRGDRTLSDEKVKEELEKYIKKVKDNKRDPPKTEIIFGPTTSNASDHAGAISVGDAKILLFPVRSARGVFAYVTSPLVLERFKRDMELAGKKVDFEVPKLEKGAMVSGNTVKITINDKEGDKENGNKKDRKDRVVLEEVVLEVESDSRDQLQEIVKAIKEILPEGIKKEDVKKRLVIVPDEVFSAFVRMNTEIVARITINSTTGTVENLWYEEFLPSDTVLYSIIAVREPRGGSLKSAEEVSEKLTEFFSMNPYLQVGGDETVGKGFVMVKLTSVEGTDNGQDSKTKG